MNMNSVDLNTAKILETEIEILQRRADASKDGGMGNYYTCISILKQRVQELRSE
jgi:hypothetical protein|tara:strand:+ start:358 stop:519 length:162 start_codon:yes stop_codon:yes gene_type:complete